MAYDSKPTAIDAALAATPADFLDMQVIVGASLKGAKTPPGTWRNMTKSVRDLVEMLREHETGAKDGKCILQGEVIAGERKAQAMRANYLLMLDLDTGDDIDAVCERIRERGLFAMVWTTWSHLKSSTDIRKDAVLKFIGADREPTPEEILDYLRSEKLYRPWVLENASLRGQEHKKDGVVLVVDHAPMPKFRVLFVLDKPFVFAEVATNPRKGVELWKAKYAGVSATIGAAFDRSCTDPSRLMYTPRHPKNAADFDIRVIPGLALDLDSVEALSARAEESVWDKATGIGDDLQTPWLKRWAAENATRFDAESFFRDYCEERGGRSGPGAHFECPNDAAHTNAGDADDKGFYAVSAGDGDFTEGFIAKCMHASCTDVDRLGFVDRIICANALGESDLDAYVFAIDDGAVVAPQVVEDAEIVDPVYSDPAVVAVMEDLNRKWALVTMGSHLRVMQTPSNESELPKFLGLDAWRGLLDNKKIAVGNLQTGFKQVKASKLWMEWPQRRTYELGVVFEPGANPPDAFNLWRGLPVKPRAGSWRRLKRHVFNNVCDRDKRAYRFLILWLAQLLQRPGEKMGSAVAIVGAKGTGKSKLFDWVRAALRHHAVQVDNTDHITNNFNAHTRTALLMVCEEAFWAGDQQAGNKLKSLITSDVHMLELKGVDPVQSRNFLRFVFISNEKWVVPCELPDDERRYFVLETNPRRRKQTNYFKSIDAEMRSGGLEAMVAELLAVDPERLFPGEGWDALRNPPATAAHVAQAEEGFSVEDRFFFDGVNRGHWRAGPNSELVELKVPASEADERGRVLPRFISAQDLRDHCDEWCRRHGRRYPLTRTAFTELVRKWLLLEGKAEGAVPSRVGAAAIDREPCYRVPGLAVIREHHQRRGLEFDPLVGA